VEEVRYTPIGVIRSPFAQTAGMPIQAVAAEEAEGSGELAAGYRDGLRDVEGFSHLVLVYHRAASSPPVPQTPQPHRAVRGAGWSASGATR
jgi:tRNA (Thr-GGU) A37 N-methylase